MSHLMNTYARQPTALVSGEGAWAVDDQGKRYLDALAGIAVNTLGHRHPKLVAALTEQIEHGMHFSNLYRSLEQERLATRLADLYGGAAASEVFFCNSGCEANEAAIKLARFYGHKRGIEAPAIVVMENAFHGRTMATLSATGNRKVQVGFEPLVGGFLRVPYNDIAAIEQIASHHGNVVAVMFEVIQGEGGIQLAHIDFQQRLAQRCIDNEWLLICDEVQCGVGRTGTWFAFQHAGISPDIVTLAKGLGGGVPIGACIASGRAHGLFGPGNHGSTFGGNALACTAALTTLAVIESDGLLDRAKLLGERLRQGFRAALAGVKAVVDIRGEGLMIGIELDRPCAPLVAMASAAGLLINVTHERVIRLLPPLIFSDSEADLLLSILSEEIKAFAAQS